MLIYTLYSWCSALKKISFVLVNSKMNKIVFFYLKISMLIYKLHIYVALCGKSLLNGASGSVFQSTICEINYLRFSIKV